MDLTRLWRAAATALVLATFLVGRQIASWGTPRNRWTYFWQRQDGLALIVAVLLLALAVFTVGMTLARWEWSRKKRLHEIGLVVGLTAALLAQFPALNKEPSVIRSTLVWIGVAALVWLAWRRWPTKLPAGARTATLLMFPLVPILFGQILLWRPWDVREQSTLPAPPVEARSGRPFVVVVIFDEWSWFRVAPGGEPSPELPNFRRLAERSVLLREARSAGPATGTSIPRLLFQAQGELVPGNGLVLWQDSSGRRPSAEVPAMFDRLRQLGYRSVVHGFYVNYRALLGPDAPDQVVSLPYIYKRSTWTAEVGLMLMRNLQHWTDPVSQAAWPRLSSALFSRSWAALFPTMERGVRQALISEPDNTFLILHLPLPHAPFVLEADGSYRGPYQGERLSNDSAGYGRHLRYTDKVLGQIVATLDSTGRLDHTLLVVTSDHSWRKEPDSSLAQRPDAVLRVPLLIKWPGQARAVVSDEPFCQLGLWPLFEAAITPPAPPPLTDSLWRALSAEARGKRCSP